MMNSHSVLFLSMHSFCTNITPVISRLFSPFSPGSAGLVPNLPIPTKYTLTLLVTITVLLYTAVNLVRRFYLERYDKDECGNLYPVECKPTKSLLNGLFSLSARWGVVKPTLNKCTQRHMFAGWAQAFIQCGRYWKRLGDGMVTVTFYPEADKYKIMMKNTCDIVLINHELTKNMALFRDENQGIHISRWSAIDFSSLQPRSETFCLRWNNLGVAESFNQTFYKCTQPACYTDNDLFPMTSMDKNSVPGALKQMDMTTQWPATNNQFAQTAAAPPAPCIPTCATVPCTRLPGEPLYDIYSGGYADGGERSGGGRDSRKDRPPRSSSSHHGASAKRSKSKTLASKKSSMGRASVGGISSRSSVRRQPSKMSSRKSRMGSSRSRLGPSRSRIKSRKSMSGRPSRIRPSASRMNRRPSAMGSRRSVMAPRSRASMKSRKSVY